MENLELAYQTKPTPQNQNILVLVNLTVSSSDLKSSLAKNYLMSYLLYMIFNFSLKLCGTLFTATRSYQLV
jgi:hypothetical protein